jgi:hypothetical protein
MVPEYGKLQCLPALDWIRGIIVIKNKNKNKIT